MSDAIPQKRSKYHNPRLLVVIFMSRRKCSENSGSGFTFTSAQGITELVRLSGLDSEA